jgi:hypothetical protein
MHRACPYALSGIGVAVVTRLQIERQVRLLKSIKLALHVNVASD